MKTQQDNDPTKKINKDSMIIDQSVMQLSKYMYPNTISMK